MQVVKITNADGSVETVAVNDFSEYQLRQLCEKVRGDMTHGAIEVELRNILGNTKYSYLLKPVVLGKFPDKKRLVKFVYDCWLITQGLKINKY